MGAATVRALYELICDLEEDAALRGIVFHVGRSGRGVGPAGRLATSIAALGPADGMSVFTRLEKALSALERFARPTAVVFDGAVGSFGLELALVCDLKLASPDTVFYIQGPERGFLPGMSMHRLARYVGLGQAKHIVLHRQRLGAEDAMRFAIVDRVVEAPERALRAELPRLLSLPSATLNLARQMLHEAGPMSYPQAYDAYKAAQFQALHRLTNEGPDARTLAGPLSAATYVHEPLGAFVAEAEPALADAWSPLREPGDEVGCDAAAVVRGLDSMGVAGAVLYPTRVMAAWRVLHGVPLERLLRRYNDWVLDLCAEARDRLKPVVLLDVDDPVRAAAEVRRTAAKGAAAALVPLFPHGDRRYDSPRYAPLWSALEECGMPLTLHRGTSRGVGSDPRPFDLALHRLSDDDPVFEQVFDALEASYARLAVVAMTLSGVFARHPGLTVVTVGFGHAWAPYALLRLDEQYEVRPERAGDVARSAEGELFERHAFAVEREGFRFPPGERPSDHFRRHVFVASDHDVGLELTDVFGVRNLLWAPGHTIEADGSVVAGVDSPVTTGLSAEEREAVERRNTALLYRFPDGEAAA